MTKSKNVKVPVNTNQKRPSVFGRIFRFIWRKKWWVLLLLILIGGGLFFFTKKSDNKLQIVTVK